MTKDPRDQLRPDQLLFTGREAATITGASYRNVDYWARIDLAAPTIEAQGPGSVRGYTLDDLVILKLCEILADLKIEVRAEVLKKARNYLRSPAVKAGQIDEWIHIRVSEYLELVLFVERIRRDIQKPLRRLVALKRTADTALSPDTMGAGEQAESLQVNPKKDLK